MSKLVFLIIIVAVSAGSASRPCSCQQALEDDVPHGANEEIEYTAKTVKRIKGRVLYFADRKPAGDVVVEIYSVTEADKGLRPREIALRQQRRAACVTTNDGSFCFPNLPSGRYLLRAGTRSSGAGMNEVYVHVTLDQRWWCSWLKSGKGIELELTAGA